MSSLRFLCQRCSQPLKPRPSAETEDAPAQGEPGDPREASAISWEGTESEKLQGSASCASLLAHGETPKDNADRFTLLGKSDPMRTLGTIQKAAGDIFDILSGERVVDHPLCEECTDRLLEQLDGSLCLADLDCENYRRRLRSGELAGEDEARRDALRAALRDLEQEEARLARELEDVDRDRARVAAGLEAARAETAGLEERGRRHRRDYSALKGRQLELLDELRSAENRLRRARAQLHRLQEIDVFSTAFEIQAEGPLGVINNLRLGCLPSVPVGWSEIGAAWGQVALLLLALANTAGLAFRRYRLVPRGNRSYLRSLVAGDDAELPLYYQAAQKAFCDDKFDSAMVAFLDCMQQFAHEAGEGARGLRLPYRILAERGVLEDAGGGRECYSIRTRSNTEERWTKALKFMLVNFTWSLAWASLRYRRK
uniref:Beclin 2 n=1 Tax=Prolemur simus TaxID=1328070 RepID=A0A8C9AGN8_PROSS